MSQAKVDRYKEEKKNRRQIMKRQKIESTLMKLAGVVVCAAIVVWIGFSVVNLSKKDSSDTTSETTSYTLDASALDDYLQGLNADDAE